MPLKLVPLTPAEEKWQPVFTRFLEDVSPAKNLQAVLRVGAILNWDADPYDRRTIADSSPAEGGMYFMLKGSDSWYYAKLSVNSEGQTLIKVSRLIEEGDARETPSGWSEFHYIAPESLKPYQRGKYLYEFIAEGMAIQFPDGKRMISSAQKKGKGVIFKVEGSDQLYFAGLDKGGVQLWKYKKPSSEGAPPERVAPPESDSATLAARKSAMMRKFNKYGLFEAGRNSDFSDSPKIIGISAETNRFLLDSVPENVIYAQAQMDMIHDFVTSEAGSEAFLGFVQKKINKFYESIGLPDDGYQFSKSEKETAKNQLKSLREIRATYIDGPYNVGGSTSPSPHYSEIDSVDASPMVNTHELVHSTQVSLWDSIRDQFGRAILPEAFATILSIESWGVYPELVQPIRRYLTSLPPARRKREADILLRDSFGFSDSQEHARAYRILEAANGH